VFSAVNTAVCYDTHHCLGHPRLKLHVNHIRFILNRASARLIKMSPPQQHARTQTSNTRRAAPTHARTLRPPPLGPRKNSHSGHSKKPSTGTKTITTSAKNNHRTDTAISPEDEDMAGLPQFWFVVIVVACPSCTNKFQCYLREADPHTCLQLNTLLLRELSPKGPQQAS
jgi:hypothetical protein